MTSCPHCGFTHEMVCFSGTPTRPHCLKCDKPVDENHAEAAERICREELEGERQ